MSDARNTRGWMPGDRDGEPSTVKACPRCGSEGTVYRCECEEPGRIERVPMPPAVAIRLRELHRKAFPPKRLTATPAGITVWVEEHTVWLRPLDYVVNDAAVTGRQHGWTRLNHAQWRQLRDTVDRYCEAI